MSAKRLWTARCSKACGARLQISAASEREALAQVAKQGWTYERNRPICPSCYEAAKAKAAAEATK